MASCNQAQSFKGSYQSDPIEGYHIQLSVQQEDQTFIEYIDNREVDSILGERLYMELGAMDFFETSAKSGQNVELAFIRLASETLSYNIQQ